MKINIIHIKLYLFLLLACCLPLQARAQAKDPVLWRRGWRMAVGGGGQLMIKPPGQNALTDPLIQFPRSSLVMRFTLFEWFWNRHWGASFGFNFSETGRLDETKLYNVLSLRYPGQYVTLYPDPAFSFVAQTNIMQAMVGLKYNILLSRRWCLQPGLSVGSTDINQFAWNADIKEAGTQKVTNLWPAPDSAAYRPKVTPFTLATNATGVYTLNRHWHLFIQFEYAWIKPNLRWEIIELTQTSGTLDREAVDYRQALHGLSLIGGLAFHF